jgi:hypothetical protein
VNSRDLQSPFFSIVRALLLARQSALKSLQFALKPAVMSLGFALLAIAERGKPGETEIYPNTSLRTRYRLSYRLNLNCDGEIPFPGSFFDPSTQNTTIESQNLSHIHCAEFGDINGMTRDGKLIVIQSESTDSFAAFPETWKFHFRLRMRLFYFVVGVDRLAKISNRLFSGALGHCTNKRKFSVNPGSKSYFDLVPINFFACCFASLILFQSPIPSETSYTRGAQEISFLFKRRIEANFMGFDHHVDTGVYLSAFSSGYLTSSYSSLIVKNQSLSLD